MTQNWACLFTFLSYLVTVVKVSSHLPGMAQHLLNTVAEQYYSIQNNLTKGRMMAKFVIRQQRVLVFVITSF